MATFTLRLSKKKNDLEYCEIMFRFRHGKIDLYSGSGVFIPADRWDAQKEAIVIPNIRIMSPEKTAEKKFLEKAQDKVNELKSVISSSFNEADKDCIEREWMSVVIDKYHHPEKYDLSIQKKKLQFFEAFEEYLVKKKLSRAREKDLLVLMKALKRFEKSSSSKKNVFRLDFDKISADTITKFEEFLKNEHLPSNDKETTEGEYRRRGRNTVCAMLRRLRAFFNWCNENDLTQNNPFDKYKIVQEKYGTPYYLTLEERNHIANFDLTDYPHLEIQRDIFIFQSLIGCRVSDLLKMTPGNMIKGAVEYIPHKTKDEKPLVVRVPLNDRAQELVGKYKDVDKQGKLFPFISAQKYNDALKEIFKLAKVNRLVTVQNPITGEGEQKLLCEIASSHLARRTFVGNLYKQVKDPNLVGSLSGHVEGSKAFTRYRDIDEDMKKDLVKLID
jgi:integrase